MRGECLSFLLRFCPPFLDFNQQPSHCKPASLTSRPLLHMHMARLTSSWADMNCSISFCTHDSLFFSILVEMYINYFRVIVSEEIDMDLFMKPATKQAANSLIYHTLPSELYNLEQSFPTIVIFAVEGKQLSAFVVILPSRPGSVFVANPHGLLALTATLHTTHATLSLLVLIILLTHKSRRMLEAKSLCLI